MIDVDLFDRTTLKEFTLHFDSWYKFKNFKRKCEHGTKLMILGWSSDSGVLSEW